MAFESTARHLNMTRAAEELCITQSAVSHRIRRLEKHFGRALVRRANAGLALTAYGASLLPLLNAALDGLASLGAADERRLRVAAGGALCNWWPARRLPRFMSAHPGLSIDLVPIDAVHSSIPDVDVRNLWISTDENDSRPRQASLFVERVFPVCSPALLPGGKPLQDSSQLLRLPRLHKATEGAGEWSWSVWLKHLGVPAEPRPHSKLRLADMGLVMSAAVDGAGVALTRSLLAHDALASGRLVPALADAVTLPSSKHHVARWPAAKASDPGVIRFVDWLVDEARASLAGADKLIGPGPGGS